MRIITALHYPSVYPIHKSPPPQTNHCRHPIQITAAAITSDEMCGTLFRSATGQLDRGWIIIPWGKGRENSLRNAEDRADRLEALVFSRGSLVELVLF